MRKIAGILLVVACGCGTDGPGTGPQSPPSVPQAPASVQTVVVTPGNLPLLVGQSAQLVATLRDASGRTLSGREITWATSNPGIATVSGNGMVAAAAVGATTITATSEGQRGQAQVDITSIPNVSFTSVSTGGAHTCALTATGIPYCWGRGESGQLGVPPPGTTCAFDTSSMPCILIPTRVTGNVLFDRLTGGGSHTCGLTSNGTAYCWGNNSGGQLGDNSTEPAYQPVLVNTALKFASIDAGLEHTCGVTTDGVGYCWGWNTFGQLGDGTTTRRTVPTKVTGDLVFQTISAGGYSFGHTCGVTADGDAYCWGDNQSGQLGIGSLDPVAHGSPQAVSGGLKFASLSAGLGSHTCGRTAAGITYCWGENVFGALGNGSTGRMVIPSMVLGIAFKQVVAGGFIGHTCGITVSEIAYCWGENDVGAVGDATTADRLTPSAVAGGLLWSGIDAGFRHTCAVTVASAVYCWGSGRAGQLGINSTSQSIAPSKVLGQQ